MLTGSPAIAGLSERAKRAELNMLLGRLAKPNTRSIERAIRKEYRFCSQERIKFS